MIRSSSWTFIFIILCVIVFIIQNVTDLWIYFAFFPAESLSFPWMFITSIFLHADLSHLFFNMIALFFFGTSLERLIGRNAFVALFLFSGLVGNLGYMITTTNPHIPAIGASGAIYGVMGTLAVLEPFTMVYIYGILPLPMIAAAILWGLLDFTGLFAPSGIAHGAHLGGMFVGVFLGIYYRLRVRTKNLEVRYTYQY